MIPMNPVGANKKQNQGKNSIVFLSGRYYIKTGTVLGNVRIGNYVN